MKTIDLSDLESLLYKSKTNSSVLNLLAALGDEFELSEFPDKYYHVYKTLGVELIFNKEHYLVSVITHDRSKELLHIRNQFELDFSMTMKDIEEKFGVPERSGGGEARMKYWVKYPEIGLKLSYQTKERDDLNASIENITFSKPEDSLSRIRYITRSEIHIYFQIRNAEYPAGLITDLLGIEPDRVDESDLNLYELYLSRNPHLTMKTQLSEVLNFMENIEVKLRKVPENTDLRLKISIVSFRSNSVRFKLINDHLRKFESLGIDIEYEFIT